MKAMVLAAGLGLRLRPLTVCWAKPALPVLGRPVVDYAMKLLEKADIREVVVNLHHRPDSITKALEDASDRGLRVQFSEETEILGTAGGLKKAESFLGKDTFVLINGDTLVDVDLPDLLQFHRRRGGEATMLLRPKPTGSDYTAFGLDKKSRILSMGGEVPRPLMFAGVWVLEPTVFERLRPGRFGGLELELIPSLIKEKVVYGYEKDVAWFDIGTPGRYLDTCLKMTRRGLFRDMWCVKPLEPGSAVLAGSGVTVARQVCFLGESVLGSNCRIDEGAKVQKSVLWDGVVVGKGAMVRNSILAEGVVLPPGSQTEDQVVIRAEGNLSRFRARERSADYVVASIKH